jgi:hypothetical protein
MMTSVTFAFAIRIILNCILHSSLCQLDSLELDPNISGHVIIQMKSGRKFKGRLSHAEAQFRHILFYHIFLQYKMVKQYQDVSDEPTFKNHFPTFAKFTYRLPEVKSNLCSIFRIWRDSYAEITDRLKFEERKRSQCTFRCRKIPLKKRCSNCLRSE